MTKYKSWNTQTDKLMIIDSEGKLLDVLKDLRSKGTKKEPEDKAKELMKGTDE